MNKKGSNSHIKHDGTVLEVEKDRIKVCISSAAACVGCMVEGSCTLSDKEEKIIDVTGNYNVKAGDHVTVGLFGLISGIPAASYGCYSITDNCSFFRNSRAASRADISWNPGPVLPVALYFPAKNQ